MSTTKPRRQAVVSPLLVILAIIAVIGAVRWLGERNRPLPTNANLTVLQGQVVVTRADAGSDPPMEPGQSTKLQSADEIQISQGGAAQLLFAGGETVALSSNSHLSILDLQRQPMSRNLLASLYLDQGEMLLDAPSSVRPMTFDIGTRVASIKSSGQLLRIRVLDKTHTQAIVFEGKAEVSMGDQVMEVKAGREVTVELGQALSDQPASESAPTRAPEATAPTGTAEPDAEPKATLEDWEKTMFPSITTPTIPGDEYETYTVQKGDTLSSIGRKYGLTWKQIYEANRSVLPSPESIQPGQKLRIPEP